MNSSLNQPVPDYYPYNYYFPSKIKKGNFEKDLRNTFKSCFKGNKIHIRFEDEIYNTEVLILLDYFLIKLTFKPAKIN